VDFQNHGDNNWSSADPKTGVINFWSYPPDGPTPEERVLGDLTVKGIMVTMLAAGSMLGDRDSPPGRETRAAAPPPGAGGSSSSLASAGATALFAAPVPGAGGAGRAAAAAARNAAERVLGSDVAELIVRVVWDTSGARGGYRVVNSKMGHAAERAVLRAGFSTPKDAADALRAFGESIERIGLPRGTVTDSAGHLVVPGFGQQAAVVYRVSGGKLTLQTVLEWIPGMGTPVP